MTDTRTPMITSSNMIQHHSGKLVPYAIAMCNESLKEIFNKGTKYSLGGTVRPGDICYTCFLPLVKDDVFRCLVVSDSEMYMEHEHHRQGGHMQFDMNGNLVPWKGNGGFP
jgi:hypothetical protein